MRVPSLVVAPSDVSGARRAPAKDASRHPLPLCALRRGLHCSGAKAPPEASDLSCARPIRMMQRLARGIVLARLTPAPTGQPLWTRRQRHRARPGDAEQRPEEHWGRSDACPRARPQKRSRVRSGASANRRRPLPCRDRHRQALAGPAVDCSQERRRQAEAKRATHDANARQAASGACPPPLHLTGQRKAIPPRILPVHWCYSRAVYHVWPEADRPNDACPSSSDASVTAGTRDLVGTPFHGAHHVRLRGKQTVALQVGTEGVLTPTAKRLYCCQCIFGGIV